MFLLEPELTGFQAFLEKAKPLLPIPLLAAIIPALWWFFRGTWKELDEEAVRERAKTVEEGKYDTRPLVVFVLVAVILAMQEYFGGRLYFDMKVRPWLEQISGTTTAGTFLERVPGQAKDPIGLKRYEELWGYGWWAFTRVFGYMVVPLPFWKAMYRKDSLLDMGLRTKGFFKHVWIYGLFLAVVLPAMFVVSRSPDFGSYYPFYKTSSRSWFDFLLWEAMYFVQFFALEVFFRGFWLGALRKNLGSGAIFAMAVPYCMIHFGKPYLEAVGAIVAGIALGSLSMRTKSIYQGFLVHITVAGLMDWLALAHRGQMPKVFWPTFPT